MKEEKMSFDEAYATIDSHGYKIKELTYGGNGYPEFRGEQRYAAYGFESFSEAEKFAEKIGGKVEKIHWQNGHTLAKSEGHEYEAIKVASDNYGDNYSVFIPEYEFDRLKEEVNSATSFDALVDIVNNYSNLVEEYDRKQEGEEILTYCGRYYDNIKTSTMEHSHDTNHYAIAVVINSEDYKNEIEEKDVGCGIKEGGVEASKSKTLQRVENVVKASQNKTEAVNKEQNKSI